jgi:glycosyltransferase involved in cell wall biosynthesis
MAGEPVASIEAMETVGTAVAPVAPDLTVLKGRPDLAGLAEPAGLRRIEMLAWRDLDDPEAGGSEIHASEIAARWAAAGIQVEMRTSRVPGAPRRVERDGYRVDRRGGRHLLFPRVAGRGALGGLGRADGLVEIWNGMPFFTPVWSRTARTVFLHHVHDEMWRMTLRPAALARLGEAIELAWAPPRYRHTPVVTLSGSSRDDIVAKLGLPPENITVVPPGVHARFSPGGDRSAHPLVVVVGRLVPVKRLVPLVDALQEVRHRHPELRAVIAGEGHERPAIEARIAAHGAAGWISLPGRVDDATLVGLYRQAWAVVSNSAREGWGMTLTEAAACATPAVASRIPGHLDAVLDGRTGLLFDDERGLVEQLSGVLGDARLRRQLARGAAIHARRRTWDAAAGSTLAVLAADAIARRRRLG